MRRFGKVTTQGSCVLDAQSVQEAVVAAIGPFPCVLTEQGAPDSSLFLDGPMCHPLQSKGKIGGGVFDDFAFNFQVGDYAEVAYRSELLAVQKGTSPPSKMLEVVRSLCGTDTKNPGVTAIYLWHSYSSIPPDHQVLVADMVRNQPPDSALGILHRAIQKQNPVFPDNERGAIAAQVPVLLWSSVISYLEEYWGSLFTGQMVSFQTLMMLGEASANIATMDPEMREVLSRIIDLLLSHSEGFRVARRDLSIARQDLQESEKMRDRCLASLEDVWDQLEVANARISRLQAASTRGAVPKIESLLESDWLTDEEKVNKIKETLAQR